MFTALFSVLVIGIGLRVLFLDTDLWLDEVWSVTLARTMSGPLDAFRMHESDNNHLLNTLWLWLVDPAQSFILYRLLSLLSGLATIFLLFILGCEYSFVTGFCIGAFAATSYYFCLFSTEARGYAPLLFASALAYYACKNSSVTSWRRIYPFACLFGFLSHGTFYFVFAALLCADILTHPTTTRLKRHLLSLSLGIGILCLFYLQLPAGSGPFYSYADVFTEFLSSAIGLGPYSRSHIPLRLTACLILIGLLIYTLRDARIDGFTRRFCIILFVMCPLASIFINPRVLFARYFLCMLPFIYLLLALFITRLAQESRTAAKVCGGICFLMITGANLISSGFFLTQGGRGSYQTVVDLIALTPEPKTVAGDHDFRNSLMLNFYKERRDARTLAYVLSDVKDIWPTWYLAQTQDLEFLPEYTVKLNGREYTAAGTFPYGGDSGATWILYHRS